MTNVDSKAQNHSHRQDENAKVRDEIHDADGAIGDDLSSYVCKLSVSCERTQEAA